MIARPAKGKVIGIDLGTPSVVGFAKDGERLVGQVAKRQAVTKVLPNLKKAAEDYLGESVSDAGRRRPPAGSG